MKIFNNFAQNKDMKVVFISFIFVIFFLFYPFKINAKSHINFVKLVGFSSINILFFNIFTAKVEINNYKLHIISVNKNHKKITTFKKRFFKNMMHLLQYISITNFAVVGKENDAYTTAISYGVINSVFNSIFSYLHSKKKYFYAESKVQPVTSEDVLLVTDSVIVKLNFFIIIIAFFQAIIKREG